VIALVPRRVGPVIFAVAWTLRLALVLGIGDYRLPAHPVEPGLIARSLAAGEGFSNPYGCVTGPTAHLAPVYPFLLSLFYRAFPPGSSRELAIYMFSATLASLAYALLPWLAARLRLDTAVGALAGFAGAAVPLFFWIEVESEWETPLTALFLVVALGKFAGLFEQMNIRRALTAGIVWGLALLTTPTVLFVFATLFIALVWQRRRHIAATALLRLTAAMWLPAVLFLTPWTIRNYLVFHQLIPIRGNAGLQLHITFNDVARAKYEEGVASGALFDNPLSSARACAEWARFGEVAMSRLYMQQTFAWIRANPGASARLIVGHFFAFWRDEVPSPVKTVASELLTLLGLLGLWVCFKKYSLAGQLTGIVLLTYPLVYYMQIFDTRYRYPLHPIFLLLAAVFLTEIRRIFRSGSDTGSAVA
jgi:hypothetical protein